MKRVLKDILVELREIKKMLQVIESNKEQNSKVLVDEKKLAKIIHNPNSSTTW